MTKKMLLRRYALLTTAEESIPPMPTSWTEAKTYASRSLNTTYTVQQSAWYRFHLIGMGGNGGSGGSANAGNNQGGYNYSGGGGGGGGGGAYCIHAAYLKAGQVLSVTINASGTSVNCGWTTAPRAYNGQNGRPGGSATLSNKGSGGMQGSGGTAVNGNIANYSGRNGSGGNDGIQIYYNGDRASGGASGTSGAYNKDGSKYNSYGNGGGGGRSGSTQLSGTTYVTLVPLSGSTGGNGAIIIEIGG